LKLLFTQATPMWWWYIYIYIYICIYCTHMHICIYMIWCIHHVPCMHIYMHMCTIYAYIYIYIYMYIYIYIYEPPHLHHQSMILVIICKSVDNTNHSLSAINHQLNSNNTIPTSKDGNNIDMRRRRRSTDTIPSCTTTSEQPSDGIPHLHHQTTPTQT
jgi:hypothetical protein